MVNLDTNGVEHSTCETILVQTKAAEDIYSDLNTNWLLAESTKTLADMDLLVCIGVTMPLNIRHIWTKKYAYNLAMEQQFEDWCVVLSVPDASSVSDDWSHARPTMRTCAVIQDDPRQHEWQKNMPDSSFMSVDFQKLWVGTVLGEAFAQAFSRAEQQPADLVAMCTAFVHHAEMEPPCEEMVAAYDIVLTTMRALARLCRPLPRFLECTLDDLTFVSPHDKARQGGRGKVRALTINDHYPALGKVIMTKLQTSPIWKRRLQEVRAAASADLEHGDSFLAMRDAMEFRIRDLKGVIEDAEYEERNLDVPPVQVLLEDFLAGHESWKTLQQGAVEFLVDDVLVMLDLLWRECLLEVDKDPAAIANWSASVNTWHQTLQAIGSPAANALSHAIHDKVNTWGELHESNLFKAAAESFIENPSSPLLEKLLKAYASNGSAVTYGGPSVVDTFCSAVASALPLCLVDIRKEELLSLVSKVSCDAQLAKSGPVGARTVQNCIAFEKVLSAIAAVCQSDLEWEKAYEAHSAQPSLLAPPLSRFRCAVDAVAEKVTYI
jgi:hypothetical protein